MTEEKKDYAKESGHWYAQDGSPRYSIMAKNGNERTVTLRDARKENLVPSVTSVLSILDKPGLNRWKENQVLMSALTLPKIEGESLDEFSVRVKEDSRKQSEQARDKGTFIHGQVEKYFKNTSCDPEYQPLCTLVDYEISEAFKEPYAFNTERSFSHKDGYGGKTDLFSTDFDGIVIDFKTTEFTADNLPPGWPEQCWQLAAYRHGLNMPEARAANVYISTSVENLVHVRKWSNDELNSGLEVFLAALELWKRIKKYRSEY